MKTLVIVALCVCSAVIYGVIHDQITARICVEYFTIGHPPVFHTDSPTLLGLGWGVIATWWVGLILGVPLAMVARLGPMPKKTVASLIRPLITLLLIMACCAVLSGVIGYLLARSGKVYLMEPMASAVPVEKHVRFIADLWSHVASYGVGFVGGIVLIVRTWWDRAKLGRTARENMGTADRFKKAMLHWSLTRLACAVGATEAIAFGIDTCENAAARFVLITHIRPGKSSEEDIEKSRAAFREIAAPCIEQVGDGAIEVGPRIPENPRPQFCLVLLICEGERLRFPLAVFQFIVRCVDHEEATRKLRALRDWKWDEKS